MALHLRRVNFGVLERYVNAHTRTRGIATMRRAVEHAEPKAESPMESRMRMLFVLAGLPRPEAQVKIFDTTSRLVGRPDLYYRDARLAIEYDGDVHNGSIAQDNRRQNRLIDCGIRILRFTATDIYLRPQDTVTLVRRMLAMN